LLDIAQRMGITLEELARQMHIDLSDRAILYGARGGDGGGGGPGGGEGGKGGGYRTGLTVQREEQVDVLIVTAVKEEWDAVLAVDTGAVPGSVWKPRPEETGPEVVYRNFTVEGGVLRFAVVQSFGMGREQAAITATSLLERHPEIRCLAMCGVCAGRRGDVALGDVIIADRTWPYDAGKLKVTVDEQGHRAERFQGDMDLYRIHPPEWKQRAERFQPDPTAPWIKDRPSSYEEQGDWVLERLAKNVDPVAHADRPVKCPDWGKVLEHLWKVKRLKEGEVKLTPAGRKHIRRRMTLEPDGLRESGPFKVVVGPIASGAPVVQDPTIFDRLAETGGMRKVVGLEMETSAILTLAYLRKVPHAVVMKGVMDHADAFKSDNMKAFAARASAECLFAFVAGNMPQRLKRPAQEPRDQAPTFEQPTAPGPSTNQPTVNMQSTLIGSGAIAQGKGAVAGGEGSIVFLSRHRRRR
jgi:nucleoside phosphorylase